MRRSDFLLLSLSLIWIGALFGIFIKTDEPVGSVEGVVLAGGSGKALPNANVTFYPVSEVPREPYSAKTDANGHFVLRGIPAGEYSIYCSSSAHALMEDRARMVVIREGETSQLTLKLRRVETSLNLWVDKPIYTTDDVIRVWASGYAPSPKLRLSLYRIELEKLTPPELFHLSAYVYPWRQPSIPPNISLPISLISSWEEEIQRDAEDTFNWGRNLPYLGPGFYRLEAESDKVGSSTIFLVTNLSLLLKRDGQTSLVWATDLRNGEPLEGVELLIRKGKEFLTHRTGKDGLWKSKSPFDKIIGRLDSSYAFLSLGGDFPSPVEGNEGYKIYTYTERPIYRPGQTVFFKSIIRKVENQEYKVPPPLTLSVEATDGEANPLYRANLKTNAFGSCSGSFKIPPTAKPGSYAIFVSYKEGNAHDVREFQVSVYRKPEFEVKVEPEKQVYHLGETARIEVKADYLFGIPVAGATVDYEVYRSPLEYFEGGEYGELIQAGTTQTDQRGRAIISIPLQREFARMRDYSYSVDVTVSDASNRTAQATASFDVMRNPFRFDMFLPHRIFTVGEQVGVKISYSSPDKKRRKIRISLQKFFWQGRWAKQKKEGSWQFEMEDGEERTLLLPLMEEGEYELTARVGKMVIDTLSLTVLPSLQEGCYSLPQPLERPRLLPDKSTYERGEEGFFLLDMPYRANVLLTYEGNRLYKYEVRHLERGRHLLRIPKLDIQGSLLHIEASLVQDGKLFRDSISINIHRPERKLKLRIETDKKIYEPRDEVLCKVSLKDDKGRPLKGELSIAVVDEGIFKIMEEDADWDIKSAFTPEEFNEVLTLWSGEQIYLGPVSKAFAPEEVRQYFPDTAFWLPSLITDKKGNAVFRFKLPDNITSWRITAVGNTLASVFGAGKINIISQKNLFVRLAMPPFLRQGDTTTVTGIVHNRTQQRQRVKVELSAENLTILGSKERELEVEAEGEREVEWVVKVGETQSATLTLYALGESGLKDAMKLTIPILPFGLPKEYSKSGQAKGTAVERINIERDAIPSSIQLKLYLSPSITSSILGALEYLVQYPYGCTEQTVSTFLPDIAVHRFLKERGIRNEKLEKLLPDMISNGIFRLYSLRHSDGGWGWISSDLTLPWTTTYALWGLWEAKKAGFPVNEDVLQDGKKVLIRIMQRELNPDVIPKLGDWEREQWLFAFYVLTLMGEDISPYPDYFLPILKELSPKGKALLTLTYLNLDKKDKAKQVFQQLWDDRKENGDICYWGNGYGDVEDTAYALRALLKLQPRNFACVKVANFILGMRRGRGWLSTRDTAQVILSLLEFSKIWEDLHPNFLLNLQVNGTTVRRIHFAEKDVFNLPVEVNLQEKDLKVGSNEIRLLIQGKGKLFYSLKLEQVLRKEKIEEDKGSLGIEVVRVYRPLFVSQKGKLEWKTGSPQEEFGKGKLIEVELSLSSPYPNIPSNYLILEEPLPPGCEFMGLSEGMEFWDYEELGDKVAFYLNYIGKEGVKLRYRLRAERPGNYRVMPTVIYNMYFPQYRSMGASNRVNIK